ncbi:DUF6264 family protein [Microbacterium sp. SS28]|uniref:DUF6264 family protein n=1 Tax=Microbacterium sp. SS28 TaxID=2919948 RepID=UPI001FAACBFA|nr:DUF6264 family protein [Microbacterium sp. SS28]
MTTPPPVPPAGQPSPSPQSGYPGYAAPNTPGGYAAQAPGAYPPPVYGAPPSRPPRQPVQVWDIVLTIVFLVGLVVLTAFASFAGLFLVMASDSCGARDCSVELITTGWIVGTLLPWVVLIAAAIVSIVFMVKRKIAFYIPLLGAVGVAGALVLGFVIAGAGVPSA